MSEIQVVRLISCFVFFVSIQTSYAEDVQGSFRCEVDDVIVLAMEDGAMRQYSGFKGWIESGETMFFKYTLQSSINYFTIESSSRDRKPWIRVSGYFEKNPDMKEVFPDVVFGEDGRFNLSPDEIYVDAISRGELELQRYFKNDWHGFLKDDSGYQMAIYGLNCRHVIDGMDEIIELMKGKGY
jgi:hypothetical protein